jgi:hypothetical protein
MKYTVKQKQLLQPEQAELVGWDKAIIKQIRPAQAGALAAQVLARAARAALDRPTLLQA